MRGAKDGARLEPLASLPRATINGFSDEERWTSND